MGQDGPHRFPHRPGSTSQAPLAEGAEVRLDPQQTNYLVNVLRLGADAPVLLFNGRDGEFASKLASASRKSVSLVVGRRIRPQEAPPDVDYLFAPLKHARLDYMAQKAVEMGARRLMPLITRRTQVARVNLERLRANAIEACEQCGVIWAPEVAAPVTLEKALASWPRERLHRVLRRGGAAGEPARRAGRSQRGAAASASSSAPRAASTTTSGRRSSLLRGSCA